MKKEIYIVQPLENIESSKSFFSTFNSNHNYLSEIDLKYTPEVTYDKYSEDFMNLNRLWSAKAELIDTRNLIGYESDPVRLVLSKDFYKSSTNEQKEMIFHELGHFITNTNLIEIRNFLAKENPKILRISNSNLTALVNAHNEGLSYIFQIPKLIQEVNAELWGYENEPEFCKTRLQFYCQTIDEFIASSKKGITVSQDFFYQIPRLLFLILWRESIVKYTDYDFSKKCSENTKSAFEILKKLATESGWDGLKLLNRKNEILKAIEYKDENIDSIKVIYLELFEEYISKSSQFFPSNLRTQIRQFYNT
jgi:hypothetical protein